MSLFSVISSVAVLGSIQWAVAAAPPVGKFAIDTAHSKVGFEISHLVVSSVDGQFDKFSGTIEVADKMDKSKVNVEIDANSISTANGDRDTHLKSADFFDAKKYPKITFKSKSITGTPEAMKIVGDLTMHGETHEITLDGKFKGAVKDMQGKERAAFEANGKMDRKTFGLKWNKAIEAGPVVGDEVTMNFKVEAVREGGATKEPKK
jgi:polyisoprenoid-binding protein YceI